MPDEGKVSRGGEEVHLTKTEFRLLCELADNPGKVFSREALLDKVWGYDYFEMAGLSTFTSVDFAPKLRPILQILGTS